MERQVPDEVTNALKTGSATARESGRLAGSAGYQSSWETHIRQLGTGKQWLMTALRGRDSWPLASGTTASSAPTWESPKLCDGVS